ncbi:hypothetical protein [Kordia jejudonensis]|uniref:hypothetical protein n=1 Tax=Kordia jejudonensis TaxID=1348245 RepID=UPI0006298923|nr:hypothetical protein [Kordia jejudonensis]
MKFIYYTNKIVLVLTIIGYSMLYPGLFMQVILGGIQVLFFLVLLFNYDKFSKKIKDHLLIYGIIASCYLLVLFSNPETSNDVITMICMTVIPMIIASYFTYIVYELKKKVL